MEIIGVSDGYSGSDLSGYNWTGPDSKPGTVAQVVNVINKKYELRVT